MTDLFDGRFLGAPWPMRRVTRDEMMDCYQFGKVNAQGTEAHRAETVKHGLVHDGPVAASDAPQGRSND